MSEVAIRVENLSKRYQIGAKKSGSFRETLANTFRRKTEAEAEATEFWALKDVSFDIKRGEAVGIIGKNGAGKSTLLKVLSRITEPTRGRIEINGRVASLLEVGTGFHPELTGRENIFMNGTILGMTRREIKAKLDEIIDFSGVEKFIDTPVKRYSSGMYVRLAFAVAAYLEPEILIIDEVLAVGDAEFQKKCLGKMGEVAGQGRTVLFVSHSMDAVLRLCTHGIFLKKGYIEKYGATEDIVNTYLKSDFGAVARRNWNIDKAPGTNIVRLLEVKVHDRKGKIGSTFNLSESVGITMRYQVLESGHILNPAFNFYNAQGINIFDTHEAVFEWRRKIKSIGQYTSTVWIPDNFLSEGIIIVSSAIVTQDPFLIHLHEKEAIAFNMIDKLDKLENSVTRGDYVGPFPGVIRPLLKWESAILEENFIPKCS